MLASHQSQRARVWATAGSTHEYADVARHLVECRGFAGKWADGPHPALDPGACEATEPPIQRSDRRGTISPHRASEAKVSVVIPAFDRATTVNRAVLSVLGQDLPPFEVIVVDDGSTDGTAEAVASIPDERVVVLRQTNRGVSAARNAGASATRGDYIAFLDSDDIATPPWLLRLVTTAEESQASVVFCGVRRINPALQTEQIRLPRHRDSDRSVFYLAGSYMLERSIFTAVGGFDEDLRFSENHELGMRINELCESEGIRTGICAEPLVDIYTTESGNSHPAKLDATLRILSKHNAKIRVDRRRHARWLGIAAVESARHHRHNAAARYAVRALRLVPEDPRAWMRLVGALVPPLSHRRWGDYPHA